MERLLSLALVFAFLLAGCSTIDRNPDRTGPKAPPLLRIPAESSPQ